MAISVSSKSMWFYCVSQAIAEDARLKVEKEQAIAEQMAAETTAMAEDAQRDLGVSLCA